MAYPASINKLPQIAYVDSDGSIAEAITIPSTPPYTHMLGQSAPANYPAGYQIVPSSTAGAVSVSGGGYGSWAQVTGSPSGGQFAIDTTTSPTGGTVTFSATDAGKSVTINWTAALLPNKQWMQDIWAALHDIVAAAGAANGFAMLNSANAVLQDPASKGQASGLATLDSSQNIAILSGKKLHALGQTSNSAIVANQAVGGFTIPTGTANGASITVTNSLCAAGQSFVFLQVSSVPDQGIRAVQVGNVNTGSFTVTVITNGSATVGSAGCQYLIVN